MTTTDTARTSGVRTYGGGGREKIAPFPFTLESLDGELSPEFFIDEPDSGMVMEITDNATARRSLLLLCGDQWGDVREWLEPLHPNVMVDLLDDVFRHFKLDQDSSSNRASRRQGSRRPRR